LCLRLSTGATFTSLRSSDRRQGALSAPSETGSLCGHPQLDAVRLTRLPARQVRELRLWRRPRTGNPNHRGIPNWPAFSAEKCQTMIFDRPCQMKENPDTAERRAISPA